MEFVTLTINNRVMEAIAQVPKTALDVFRMLPEGTLCEVIDNVLYMSPAPKYTHQRLVGLFSRIISNHLEQTKQGELIISPFDVYLEHLQSAVQPDLLFLSNENKRLIGDDGYLHGAPDMVIEILSADKKRDTTTKRNLYERAGVKEYIMADPGSRKFTNLQLIGDRYETAFESEGTFKSFLLNLQFSF
jgi:Uma2 family endonuclease